MTVTNEYYEFDPAFVPATKARSGDVNSEFLAVQAAFDLLPSTASAMTRGVSTVGTETGSGNSYEVAMPDTRTSNQSSDLVTFRATHSNTGAITLNVDTLGAVSARNHDDTEFESGAIISGRYYTFRYDATLSRFVAVTETDAALQVAYAIEWATKAEDSLISTAAGGDGSTDYSALHWAAKAATSALGIGASNVSYRGDHDASSNTAPTTPTDRSMYRISVAGTFSSISWRAGDYAIYDGSAWDKLLPPGAALSVLGVAGSSAADYADISAGADNRVLARTASALSFVQLTAGMFPNGICTSLTGAQVTFAATEIQLDATTIDINGDIDADGTTHDINGATSVVLTGASAVITLASTEVDLTATTIDINGNLDVDGSGAHSIAGGSIQLTTNLSPLNVLDAIGGSTTTVRSDTDFYVQAGSGSVHISADGGSTYPVTIDGTEIDLTATTLDFNGTLDVDGGNHNINSSGTMSLVATTEIDLTATTIDINGAVTVSGILTVESTDGLIIENANPTFWLKETGVTVDNGEWLLEAQAEQINWYAINDAHSGSSAFMRVLRTGTTIDEVELNATTLDFNGNADVSGTLGIGGLITGGNSLELTSAGSYGWAGDTDTYIHHPAANQVALRAGGTNAILIVSTTEIDYVSTLHVFSGEINLNSEVSLNTGGFFTANATNGFRVNDSANTVNLYVITDAGEHTLRDGSGTAVITIESDGSEVDIAATTFDINAVIDADGTSHTLTATSGDIGIEASGSVIVRNTSVNTDTKLELGSSGGLGWMGYDSTSILEIRNNNIGASVILEGTSSGPTVQSLLILNPTSGDAQFPLVGTTGSSANAFLDSGDSNNLLRSTSSRRYKTDIEDLDIANRNKILDMRPIQYHSLAKADDPERLFYGLVAEEVNEIDPRFVNYDAEGRPDGVQYERLVVPLLALVKELKQEVAALKAAA